MFWQALSVTAVFAIFLSDYAEYEKGAEGMLAILETEAMDSLERRKEHALQLGEKAGTRLLFPMMLMLLIVMGIIMVPAFMTM